MDKLQKITIIPLVKTFCCLFLTLNCKFVLIDMHWHMYSILTSFFSPLINNVLDILLQMSPKSAALGVIPEDQRHLYLLNIHLVMSRKCTALWLSEDALFTGEWTIGLKEVYGMEKKKSTYKLKL